MVELGESFVQGMEVWVPDGDLLRHHSGAYGHHTEFARVSAQKTFRFGEGLPGSVWASGKPEVWKELSSHFVRSEVANAAGLDAALGMPLYRGSEVSAVVVLLCGRRERTGGCIEVWNRNRELELMEHGAGYYGRFEQFGKISRLLQFQRGTGLPGIVWARGVPQLIDVEGQANAFVRASIARECGLDSGIALPIHKAGSVEHVVILLSASATPIARAFEVWVPYGEELVLEASQYSPGLEEFAEASQDTVFRKGEGLPGKAFTSELPVVFDHLKSSQFVRYASAERAGLEVGLALPIRDEVGVRAVACLLS
ncbi:MAG: hypothetical protein QM756_39490 [Polyangiaceae bacterium]